jgi:hypothetical protein
MKTREVIGQGRAGCSDPHKVSRFRISRYFYWQLIIELQEFFKAYNLRFSHNDSTYNVYAIERIYNKEVSLKRLWFNLYLFALFNVSVFGSRIFDYIVYSRTTILAASSATSYSPI